MRFGSAYLLCCFVFYIKTHVITTKEVNYISRQNKHIDDVTSLNKDGIAGMLFTRMKHHVDRHQRSRGTRAAARNQDASIKIQKPLFEKRQMQEFLTLKNKEEKRLGLAEDTNKCNKMRLVVGIVLGAVVTMIVLGLVAHFYFSKRNDQDSKLRTSMKKPKTSIRKPPLPKRFEEESDPYDEIVDSEEGIYIEDDEIQPMREEHEINNLRPPPPIPKGIQPLRKRSEGIYERPMRPIEGHYLELE